MGGFLDKAYGITSADGIRRLYEDWSSSYDDEIAGAGYATPGRVAAALAGRVPDLGAPILDFGCGTGVSGAALRSAGFRVIDGVDLSTEMLARAEAKGLYRGLAAIGADEAPPSGYSTVAAIGVIGPGAAPLQVLDRLVAALAPDGLLGFSLNDHALAEPAFPDRVDELTASGTAILRFREHGDHLPGIGIGATVFVLQKQ